VSVALRVRALGKRFGVTRERIRQIEVKALRKLRHPSRARVLKELPPRVLELARLAKAR